MLNTKFWPGDSVCYSDERGVAREAQIRTFQVEVAEDRTYTVRYRLTTGVSVLEAQLQKVTEWKKLQDKRPRELKVIEGGVK